MTEEEKREQVMTLEKPFYSIYEAADVLGVHERSVRNYIKRGDLKAGKSGRQWRIAKADLLAFVQPINAPTQN
jgi:excisionase family DNA binding protein